MNIWYSICGEGLGHVNRSIPIINMLKDVGDTVNIFSYGDSFENVLYDKYKGCCYLIPGVEFGNKVSYIDVIKQTIKISSQKTLLFNFFDTLPKPELIISDFEPTLVEYGQSRKIPTICIDNQHKFATIDWSLPWGLLGYNILFNLYLKWKFNVPYIATTFHPSDDNTVFPLFNDQDRVKPTILVYVRGPYLKKVIEECEEVSADFIIYTNYSIDTDLLLDNITVKEISDEFKKDLLKCDGVICNSGNQLISECIALNKRILCFPMENQYEQYANSHYIKKYGFGMTTTYKKFNAKQIEEAFSLCPKKITKTRLLKKIRKISNQYSSQISI